jgi:hypothetical protein
LREEQYISNPRPLWKEEETDESRTQRVMVLGGTTAGVVVRVTKKGVEFNGYYAGFHDPTKYALTREFSCMDWSEFDKMREQIMRKEAVQRKLKVRAPDSIDENPSDKYLESLPQVTLNGQKYYMDLKLQQRRPVDHPEQVFNFENQPAKEPT